MNLCLISEITEVFTIQGPYDKICIPRTQLRVLFITQDLSLFKVEASINTKHLVIEVPRAYQLKNEPNSECISTYSESFPTHFQLDSKLTEGRGHARQRMASSPGDVPSTPAAS